MNKNMYLTGVLAAFLLAGAVAGVAPVFADDEGEEEEDDEREGSSFGLLGEMEDDEFEEDDDERGSVGGLSGLILYGVIAAVAGTIGYTGYKIFAGRRKAVRTNP